jgi:hypothetical protein
LKLFGNYENKDDIVLIYLVGKRMLLCLCTFKKHNNDITSIPTSIFAFEEKVSFLMILDYKAGAGGQFL